MIFQIPPCPSVPGAWNVGLGAWHLKRGILRIPPLRTGRHIRVASDCSRRYAGVARPPMCRMREAASGPGTTKAPSREYKGVVLGMGNWLLGACYLEFETENLELVLGAQVPGAGCRVPGAGCRVPGAGCRVP